LTADSDSGIGVFGQFGAEYANGVFIKINTGVIRRACIDSRSDLWPHSDELACPSVGFSSLRSMRGSSDG
jgi:hypothetical protein